MTQSRLRIGVLLPEVLGTYSDAGSATVLAQRARWRGIEAEVLQVAADQTPPAECDIYVLGGGEDVAQQFAASWLRRFPALMHALDGSAVTLAVCAGMQILGTTITDVQGKRHAGLGLLDLATSPGRRRAVGEIVSQCEMPGVGLLTGFENHLGVSTLGSGAAPLGHVLAGTGNGNPDRRGVRVDGAVTDRIVATYLHGPVLARNPALADELLRRVIGRRLPELEVPDQAALRRTYLSTVGRSCRFLGSWRRHRR
ncbi:MAG: hypothetical protein QOJ68_2347 [Blastococcus sp.]|jgi:CobQ-like glutamine amidotransferase family enzyme|nr:hypothetical protein [Blastococcus sp.]